MTRPAPRNAEEARSRAERARGLRHLAIARDALAAAREALALLRETPPQPGLLSRIAAVERRVEEHRRLVDALTERWRPAQRRAAVKDP